MLETVGEVQPTVYVVDGDSAVRDGLRALLGLYGYRVQTYDSAEAFLEEAELAPVSCLIAEVHLPGMSGLELHEMLIARGRRLPTIVTTTRGDVPTAVRALRAGAIDFFEKPFVGRALTDRVRETLEAQRKSRRG